jgi:hypothetical protein
MIKLSKASKMPCRSWSLQALDTCPGSKGDDGELVPACKGCYATTGNYRFPNVKAPRVSNQTDWQRKEWAAEMVAELDNDRYFRWFDSGDMYSVALAKKMLQVMKDTPHCNHWLPTRMYKFKKFEKVLADMAALDNVVVRSSSDEVDGSILKGYGLSSTIVPDPDKVPKGATLCRASEREGKCGPCRACWDQDTQTIAYPAHGKQMMNIIARQAA